MVQPGSWTCGWASSGPQWRRAVAALVRAYRWATVRQASQGLLRASRGPGRRPGPDPARPPPADSALGRSRSRPPSPAGRGRECRREPLRTGSAVCPWEAVVPPVHCACPLIHDRRHAGTGARSSCGISSTPYAASVTFIRPAPAATALRPTLGRWRKGRPANTSRRHRLIHPRSRPTGARTAWPSAPPTGFTCANASRVATSDAVTTPRAGMRPLIFGPWATP